MYFVFLLGKYGFLTNFKVSYDSGNFHMGALSKREEYKLTLRLDWYKQSQVIGNVPDFL